MPRAQGDLPHRRRRLAAQTRTTPARASRQATVDEVRAALDGVDGGMRPKLAACVEAIAGGVEAAHIIDGRQPAHAAARALHRRRHRHEDHRMKLAELQELEARWVMPTYARAPVEFVRGEGARLWDSEGKEYLDFLAGISVCSVGHCHPDGGRGGARAGRHPHARLQPLPTEGRRAARRAALRVEPRRPGVSLQLGDRGQRVRDQARPQARPRPRHRGRPRSWCSRAPSTAGRWARSRRRPGSPPTTGSRPTCRGFRAVPRDDPDALSAAVGDADGRGHARADPGRDRGPRRSPTR